MQADKFANGADRINFSLSMGVGGLVVTLIASLVVIFLSSFLGKIGSLSLGIGIASLLPIISTVVIQVSKADATYPINSGSFLINQREADKIIQGQSKEFIRTGKEKVDLNELISIGRKHYQPLLDKEIPKVKQFVEDG